MKQDTKIALQRWELENDIVEENLLFNESDNSHDLRPWEKDEQYFKKVKISALALLKMVMHAKSGGNIEVMGLFQGKCLGDTIIVMDAFAIPVEACEVRVNAGHDANEYMINYSDAMEKVNREEGIRGWYHSHPGYGCWLSGIDVDNQKLHQNRMFEPYLAIVVDPKRTMSAGKVEIGCFRTYTDDYAKKVKAESEKQDSGKFGTRMDKIEEMGNHWHRYYQLQTSFYKSAQDNELISRLWNEYWIATLSSSPLLSNQLEISKQVQDINQKIGKAGRQAALSLGENQFQGKSQKGFGGLGGFGGNHSQNHQGEIQEQIMEDVNVTEAVSKQVSCECNHAIMIEIIKKVMFNTQK